MSVRRVEDVTEALWGTRVSSSTVSKLNQKIYRHIKRWRNQKIEESHPYVYLDGVVLKRSYGTLWSELKFKLIRNTLCVHRPLFAVICKVLFTLTLCTSSRPISIPAVSPQGPCRRVAFVGSGGPRQR